MKHIMIDIETMGKTASAAILSIGAVTFTSNDPPIKTDGFYGKASLESNLHRDRTVDASTIEWWLKQSDIARKELITNSHIDSLLADFTTYIQMNNKADTKIWANGVNFDIKILEHAIEQFGLSIPWNYNQICCMRSLRTIEPYFPPSILEKTWGHMKEEMKFAHNALEDAYWQAMYVHRIMKNCNNQKNKEI